MALMRAPLVQGLVAFASAQAATRVVRLAALLVVARAVSPETIGAAALALSLFELVRVLADAGIGQRLIVADDDALPALCRTAYRLFWVVCLGTAMVQLIVAAVLAAAFDMAEPAAMLAVLSLVYIAMPPGLVQIFLTMRANRMGACARIAATQNMADCAMTLALVVVWPSAWAIVLPKLLAAPVWTVLARRSTAWEPAAVAPAPVREFALFGPAILGTEIFNALRIHGDKLIVSALLGTEMLGLYFFAFNAGLGITQSFVAACNIVVFPHLAKAGQDGGLREYRKAFATGLAMLIPVVAAQALLAPVYVPVVFGANWSEAAPLVSLLACAALPLLAGSLVGAKMRVAGRPQAEAMLTGTATLAALAGLSIGAGTGLAGACIGFGLGLGTVLLPAAAISLLPRRSAAFSFTACFKGVTS
ncbi:oligosaccharide flippase family protein [uncultured Croceicoccus sp.]|uniref:oligosaccharide flippase family protein n=1 Tax=uncultured Croceicoccus sp. TaxID=1295329 RepID=UPI00261BF76A|nr:oligosaccharide flippase family protein [uncultured Croceicoccus sp.]